MEQNDQKNMFKNLILKIKIRNANKMIVMSEKNKIRQVQK